MRGFLGVSSLMHKYCEQNSKCKDEQVFKDVMKLLNAKLRDECATDGSGKEIEEMVIVLKALGNLGQDGWKSVRVFKCANSTLNPMEVRVAALQSLRRVPCDTYPVS